MTTQTSRRNSKHVNIFSLTLSLKKGRHRVFNFAMSTFDNSLINRKMALVFKGLKCAAKVNPAYGFVLKNVEDRLCIYCNAHENSTVMERSKLVCTPDDLTNLKKNIRKMDVVDLCTQERPNAKWNFCKLTNLTVFAALIKEVPMGCKASVLPEPLLKTPKCELLYLRTEHQRTIQIESLPLQSSCSPLAGKWETRRGNIQNFQPLPD